MTSSEPTPRRLIEDWLPISEISIEAVRERAAASALPPLNWLHVWWARRPLSTSRAAVAASLLSAGADRETVYGPLGTHPGIIDEQAELDNAKAMGIKLQEAYSKPRAFTHNVSVAQSSWLENNLVTSDPVVLDITAGGGSIPFEAGRLGFRTIANELNPVAGLILRATCEWPQAYGWELLAHYKHIKSRYLAKVRELTLGIYPEEPQPKPKPQSPRREGWDTSSTALSIATLGIPRPSQGRLPNAQRPPEDLECQRQKTTTPN